MVVEHSFVTTMEAQSTMATAVQFLSAHGFIQSEGFSLAATWDTLEMRRGVKKARKAKSISDLPQLVHVNWDRGRVTVVCSIEASARWGGSGSFGFGVENPVERPKKMKLHQALLSAIAAGLERLIARGESADVAAAEWHAVENEIRTIARRKRITRLIGVTIFFLFLTAAIAAIAIAVNSR